MTEALTTDEDGITAVLNQLWVRWIDTVGGKSAFCDAILDLYQLGNEHRFAINAYTYKDMKDKLIAHIAEHGKVAR